MKMMVLLTEFETKVARNVVRSYRFSTKTCGNHKSTAPVRLGRRRRGRHRAMTLQQNSGTAGPTENMKIITDQESAQATLYITGVALSMITRNPFELNHQKIGVLKIPGRISDRAEKWIEPKNSEVTLNSKRNDKL